MGIKQFFKIKIINKDSEFDGMVISQLGEVVSLKKFKGERICNDASHTIYQSILALDSIQSLTDSEGNTTIHLNIILNKIIQQAQAGITQIWIFDSPTPNPMKVKELAKRKEKREKAAKEGKEKIEYRLNKQHIEEVQFLLNNLGIMYITAPPGIEAEQYGAYLTKGPINERFCKYMISGDSDVLFFGGNLLRITSEKSATGKTKKTIYQAFDLSDFLNETNLTNDEFLKMGVAMGSDWNEKAPSVGPGTIMKKINDVYITPTMEDAIDYYKSDIGDKIGQADIVEGKYNRDKILEFLLSKKFNKERLEGRLDAFEKTLK
jgi:5'-3' exonuclease